MPAVTAELLVRACARHLPDVTGVDGADAPLGRRVARDLVVRRRRAPTAPSTASCCGATRARPSDRPTAPPSTSSSAPPDAAGVAVPAVRFLLDADDELGAGFVMDRIDGETIPRKLLRDEPYADAATR